MLPTLSIGPFAIPTYPFSVLIAFWLGMWLTARRADRLGIDGDHAYNAGLYGLLAGILGARLWFVISHWENYASDLSQALSLSRSALSTTEGLFIGGLAALIYLQRNRVPLGTLLDAAAPGLAVALAVINVGAFMGGEGLGAAADVMVWTVDMGGAVRHPVQLYQAATNFLIASLLLALPYRPWPGFQFWLFVGLYAAGRMILEIFRARPPVIGDGYLTVQILSLAAIVIALGVMAYQFTHHSTGSRSETS